MLSFTGRLRVCAAAVAVFLPVAAGICAAASPRDEILVSRYATVLAQQNTRLTAPAGRELAQRVLLLTSYYRIDPRLLVALVTTESSWHSRAVSPSGAIGFGQLMPGTAATLDVDALEPYENLDGTARYLRRMLNRYAGRDQRTQMRLAIASYNAGPAAVARYHGVPPYRETQRYVQTVMQRWERLVAIVGAPAPGAAPPAASNAIRVAHTLRRAHGALAAVSQAYRSPYLDALDPNSVPLAATPPPVRLERSHSFVARLFGLRHRAADTAPAAAPAAAPPAATPALSATTRSPG